MKLVSNDIRNHQPIPTRLAFGKPDQKSHMTLSDNLSPHLEWADFPDGTRSFALLCIDPDVPSEVDDVNQEGKTLPSEMPRVDFCHWAMVDIPTSVTGLATGQCSNGVTPGGKKNPPGPEGSRQGLNNYTQFMAGDPDMGGEYFGYDGPCPPWNDERMHRYVFTVYALDVDRLELPEKFTAEDVKKAIDGHVLASASLAGTYTLNPAVQ